MYSCVVFCHRELKDIRPRVVTLNWSSFYFESHFIVQPLLLGAIVLIGMKYEL